MGRIMPMFMGLVSGCIIAVHMMFTELRNTFGKLMMLYSVGVIGQCFTTTALTVLHYIITAHSMMPCYLFYFLFMQSVVVADTFATTFLAYFAYLMHSTYKSQEVTKEINKKYYKNAIMYVLGVLLLFNIFSGL